MKTFEEFLTEGRDAPLYHGTSIPAAAAIISSNRMWGKSPQPGRHAGNYALSFSRNYEFSADWGALVFEMNQRLLAQRYSLQPYNFFGTQETYGRRPVAREMQTRPVVFVNQYEESTRQTIENVVKYITKIIVRNKQVLDQAVEDGDDSHM